MTAETRVINGHTYVKVKPLADQWHTTTAAILATGKPHQIPAQYRRTIDRQAWVDVEGLRNRVGNAKRPSNLDERIREWLSTLTDTGKEYEQPVEDRKEAKTMRKIVQYFAYAHECDKPKPEDIRYALDNKQVLWRCKKNHVQVLAQTLSNCLCTRTSSLLAVNKKQGVPGKFIHREWKVTWVDLEGLKKRVENTEHGSLLLDNLKQVIQVLDKRSMPDDRKAESASAPQTEQPGVKQKAADMTGPTSRLWKATFNQLTGRVHNLEDRVDSIEAGDEKAVQAMREKQTPFDALSRRVNRMATQADRLDAKTDGLVSRVSVLEDTTKWLNWSLAGVLSLRFLGLMLRLLKRK